MLSTVCSPWTVDGRSQVCHALCTLSSVRAERREPAGPRSLALVLVSAGIVPRSGVAACVHSAFSLLPLSSDRTRSLSALLLRLSMVRLAACRVVGLAIVAVQNCPEHCKDRRGFKEGEEAPLEDRGPQAGRGQGGCSQGAREGKVLRGRSRQCLHGHRSPTRQRSTFAISLFL